MGQRGARLTVGVIGLGVEVIQSVERNELGFYLRLRVKSIKALLSTDEWGSGGAYRQPGDLIESSSEPTNRRLDYTEEEITAEGHHQGENM